MYLIIIVVTLFLVRSFPSSAAPTIIMTLAVADSIHILITMLSAMRRGVAEFFRLPPFGDLGNITAMGMITALFYSFGFLPAFMAIVPVRAREGQSLLGKSMDRLGDWVMTPITRYAHCVVTIICNASISSSSNGRTCPDHIRYGRGP